MKDAKINIYLYEVGKKEKLKIIFSTEVIIICLQKLLIIVEDR